MKTFNEWLLEMNYLSIGHSFEGKYDAWVLPSNKDDIIVSKQSATNDPEFFHDNWQRGFDFKGRIDHDHKKVSVVYGNGDEDRLKYAITLLKMDYPNYTIWLFGHGVPKQM